MQVTSTLLLHLLSAVGRRPSQLPSKHVAPVSSGRAEGRGAASVNGEIKEQEEGGSEGGVDGVLVGA